MCSFYQAGVVKLVDTLDLGSSASRRGGSSPFTRTKKPLFKIEVFYALILIVLPAKSYDKINRLENLGVDYPIMP